MATANARPALNSGPATPPRPRVTVLTPSASKRRRYQPPGGLEVNCGAAMTRQTGTLVNARAGVLSDTLRAAHLGREEPGPWKGRVLGKQTRRSDYGQTPTRRTARR